MEGELRSTGSRELSTRKALVLAGIAHFRAILRTSSPCRATFFRPLAAVRVKPSASACMPKPLPCDQPAHADHAQLYELLVSELTDFAVFLVDPDGCISTWNPGVERIFGYPKRNGWVDTRK